MSQVIILFDERAIQDIDEATAIDVCASEDEIQPAVDAAGYTLVAVRYQQADDDKSKLTLPEVLGVYRPTPRGRE